jgi:hypothetical protein
MSSSLIDWLASLLNQRVVDELKVVESILQRLITKNSQLSYQLDGLKGIVEANKAIDSQALALVHSLYVQISQGSVSPEQLAALAKELRTGTDELAASVKSNT